MLKWCQPMTLPARTLLTACLSKWNFSVQHGLKHMAVVSASRKKIIIATWALCGFLSRCFHPCISVRVWCPKFQTDVIENYLDCVQPTLAKAYGRLQACRSLRCSLRRPC